MSIPTKLRMPPVRRETAQYLILIGMEPADWTPANFNQLILLCNMVSRALHHWPEYRAPHGGRYIQLLQLLQDARAAQRDTGQYQCDRSILQSICPPLIDMISRLSFQRYFLVQRDVERMT